ncbi:hypothetical protein P4S64_22935 [Vibrio sp. M60_M31a]
MNYSNGSETGTGYVFGSAASQLVESGQFVDGEFSADATDQLSAGTGRETEMEMHQFSGGLQFDLAQVGDVTIPLYLGAEFTTYDYSDTYDPQSEAETSSVVRVTQLLVIAKLTHSTQNL